MAQRNLRGQRPPLAADLPCRQCGEPIYFNYRGPVEGVCGKCADSLKRVVHGPGHRLGPIRSTGGGGRTWIAVFVLLAFAAGSVAGYLAHGFLPF